MYADTSVVMRTATWVIGAALWESPADAVPRRCGEAVARIALAGMVTLESLHG